MTSGRFLYHIGPLELDKLPLQNIITNFFASCFLFYVVTVRRILILHHLSKMETPMHNIKCLLMKVKDQDLEMRLWLQQHNHKTFFLVITNHKTLQKV